MKSWVWLVAMALGLSGCMAQGPYPTASGAGPVTGAPSVAAGAEQDYPLASADKVRITVYNEPTLSGEYSVGSNGMIAFPLVGDVRAAGASAAGLSETLRGRLADGFVRNPSVSVEVLTFRPFYVLGEVNRAGEYPYSAGMSVLQAVASAQGFSYRANKSYVYLKRAGSDREEKVAITPTLAVHPGDTIRVAERYF